MCGVAGPDRAMSGGCSGWAGPELRQGEPLRTLPGLCAWAGVPWLQELLGRGTENDRK